MHNLQIGKFGEKLACNYLQGNGYQIINRNQKIKRLELDIIATKNNLIYFFEIKTRIKNYESKREIPLSQRQIKNLKKAALAYAAIHQIKIELICFNLMIILLDNQQNKANIKIYKNIF
jgi:putative endonuclease